MTTSFARAVTSTPSTVPPTSRFLSTVNLPWTSRLETVISFEGAFNLKLPSYNCLILIVSPFTKISFPVTAEVAVILDKVRAPVIV